MTLSAAQRVIGNAELVHVILQYASDGPDYDNSLFDFARVSQVWREEAQGLLHESIWMGGYSKEVGAYELTAKRLIDYFTHNASARTRVRKILWEVADDSEEGDGWDSATSYRTMVEESAAFLALFPNVTSLAFDTYGFEEPIETHIPHSIWPVLAHISHLNLPRSNNEDLCQWLRLTPRLRSLKLGYFVPSGILELPSSPAIERLSVRAGQDDMTLEDALTGWQWVLASMADSLRHLHVSCVDWQEVEVVLVNRPLPHLETLQIEYLPNGDIAEGASDTLWPLMWHLLPRASDSFTIQHIVPDSGDDWQLVYPQLAAYALHRRPKVLEYVLCTNGGRLDNVASYILREACRFFLGVEAACAANGVRPVLRLKTRRHVVPPDSDHTFGALLASLSAGARLTLADRLSDVILWAACRGWLPMTDKKWTVEALAVAPLKWQSRDEVLWVTDRGEQRGGFVSVARQGDKDDMARVSEAVERLFAQTRAARPRHSRLAPS